MDGMKVLRDIAMVTHCVTDLDKEIDVWAKYLDYTMVERGSLGADLCATWDAQAEAGTSYAVMQPASGADVFIRFVETGERVGYWPPVTWGWNATEILVTDPDALAVKLNDSPIRRFGGPADLYNQPKAPRAIQTLSDSGAMLYFTRIQPGGSRYGLHGAKTFVDRVFNVVLGGPSLDELQHFYAHSMGLRVGDPMMFTMTLAAQACNASPDTPFPICVAPLRARNSILELDEYPENSAPRPRDSGRIPGGMSMVSFIVASLEQPQLSYRAPPTAVAAAPYHDRRVAVVEGPAGEWLELIEEPGLGKPGH
jgi:catechol 2,3-dioxygenase-like lactoylglutathione lyase family enzyme